MTSDAEILARLESLDWLPSGFRSSLARQSGWSSEIVEGVLREYARFLFLASRPGGAVPSRSIDAVWHLHLLHTRSYWGDLCRDVLGRPLHHEPGLGGDAEDVSFRGRYERTLLEYHRHFGSLAPDLWWPRDRSRPEVVPASPGRVERFLRRWFARTPEMAGS